MHKGLIFSPSGHKEKLGEGERIVFCQPKSEFCGSFAEMRKIKISQFGPLHFTFRLFSSETNDDSFQRMISELAEQIWLQNHIDAEEKKPVWSVCNGVLERQCDLSTKFFPKVLKAEPPSKKKKKVKALHPLSSLCKFSKGSDSSMCSSLWWSSYALSGKINNKQVLRARNNLEILFQALRTFKVPLLPCYCDMYYRFFSYCV